MAKQRRPQPRATKTRATSPSARPARVVGHVSGVSSTDRPDTSSSRHQTAKDQPQRRSTYFEAVALYERGLEALQHHDYRGAGDIFESVLRQYPEEKELHERVRLYLNVCRRQGAPAEVAPQTIEERLYASTLAINGGQYDQAIVHLRLVRDEDPDNDHALYMLAVAHAQRGEHAESIAHLERAILLNPENRALARHDPDLEPLRADAAFRSTFEISPAPRADRRRPLRTRFAQ